MCKYADVQVLIKHLHIFVLWIIDLNPPIQATLELKFMSVFAYGLWVFINNVSVDA